MKVPMIGLEDHSFLYEVIPYVAVGLMFLWAVYLTAPKRHKKGGQGND
ncbi:Uncharacterised protein [Mycobacterium tuberculosis]|nr:Uncharacterised protein [Mycobacterium tuberculosis]